MSKIRLACLATHPVHYFSDQLRYLATDPDLDLTVFFASDFTTRSHHDPDFNTEVTWDVPLLEGFRSEILPAHGPAGHVDFWTPRNFGLWKKLRDVKFDALWIHGYARAYHLLAATMAKRLGLRVLVRDEATALRRPRGSVNRLLKRLFFLGLKGLADGFLATGSLNAQYYRQNGIPDHRIFLMPYTVDNHRFRTQADEARPHRAGLRAELGLPPDLPVILYASRLQRRKYADDLLAAYARLERPAALLFVGEGELRPACPTCCSWASRVNRSCLPSMTWLICSCCPPCSKPGDWWLTRS